MKKVAVFLVSAGASLGVLAAVAPQAQAEPLVSVCLTITPKSVSITINDIVIGTPVAGLPTTCIVI